MILARFVIEVVCPDGASDADADRACDALDGIEERLQSMVHGIQQTVAAIVPGAGARVTS